MPNGTDDLFTVEESLPKFADDIGVARSTVEDWRWTSSRWPAARRADAGRVERSIGWIMNARRNCRDYERLPEHSEAHLNWAFITLMTRRLAHRQLDEEEPARRLTTPQPTAWSAGYALSRAFITWSSSGDMTAIRTSPSDESHSTIRDPGLTATASRIEGERTPA